MKGERNPGMAWWGGLELMGAPHDTGPWYGR